MNHDYKETIVKPLLSVGNAGVRNSIADFLLVNNKPITEELIETALLEIQAFSESHNPEVLSEFTQHIPKHLDELCRLLRTAKIEDFSYILEHARIRAKQRFPLEATLHAYRCGHRVYATWLRKGLSQALSKSQSPVAQISAASDFVLEYCNVASTIFAEQYITQTRLMADVAIDHRAELMRILLHGYDESDGRVAEVLREAGYLQGRQTYCVIAARSVDPSQMLNLERSQRLVESLDELLRKESNSRLINTRDNRAIAIVADRHRLSGWTVAKPPLCQRLSSALLNLGNAVLAGVSHDVQSTSLIPNAHREALLALQLADVTSRVVRIDELSIRDIMLQAASPEVVRALPQWSDQLITADNASAGTLIDTLRAYADANMNVLKAAVRLDVHPNTVYFRLQKIKEITGLDARSFHVLNELLLAADCRPS